MPLTVSLFTDAAIPHTLNASSRVELLANLDSLEIGEQLGEIKFTNCVFCAIPFEESRKFLTCPGCKSPCHVKCAAESLEREEGQIIPSEGECVVCCQVWPWAKFAATARVFVIDLVPEDSDEEEGVDEGVQGVEGVEVKSTLMERVLMERVLKRLATGEEFVYVASEESETD